MNTCKTCKWWSGASNSIVGGCMNPKIAVNAGGKIIDGLNATDSLDEIDIEVGRDFGCIHHEGK